MAEDENGQFVVEDIQFVREEMVLGLDAPHSLSQCLYCARALEDDFGGGCMGGEVVSLQGCFCESERKSDKSVSCDAV